MATIVQYGVWLMVWLAACGGKHTQEAKPAGAQDQAHSGVAAMDPLKAPSDLKVPPKSAARTPSGLLSVVLTAGTGADHPRSFDRVSVEYTGWTQDGHVFGTSHKFGVPATFRLQDVMPGWAEGLMLMTVGEHRRLWIPEALTRASKLGPAQGPLVMDVKLLAILPGLAPLPAPANLLAPPADAARTASGLVHAQLEPPVSEKKPEVYDALRIAYAGWSADGHMIDSSMPHGDFEEVNPSRGFPGWREALLTLREGEKRRFWIPEELAYKHFPGNVPGNLVFDIKLLTIIDRPPPPAAPKDVAKVPKNAIGTKSGIAFRVLGKGEGKLHPCADCAIDLNYSFWTTDGQLIDSTVPALHPMFADLEDGDLGPGVTEAVRMMVVGEKRRVWVPESLTTLGQVKPAPGMLVYDLHLLAIYEHGKRVDWVGAAR